MVMRSSPHVDHCPIDFEPGLRRALMNAGFEYDQGAELAADVTARIEAAILDLCQGANFSIDRDSERRRPMRVNFSLHGTLEFPEE
jgi:hypothetical protein